MCAVAPVMAVVGVASGVMSAIGQYQQGAAQEAQYKYQAQLARRNAEIQDSLAASEAQRAAGELGKFDRQQRQIEGQQRSVISTSGLAPDSFLDVVSGSAYNAALDRGALQYNAQLAPFQHQVEAYNLREQAKFNGAAAQSAGTAKWWNTGSSLLSTASQLAPQWYEMSRLQPKYGMAPYVKDAFRMPSGTGRLEIKPR